MSATHRTGGSARRLLALLAAVGLAAAWLGCTGLGGRRWGEHPVTITEIVILSQHGVAPEKIIGKMKRGGTVYLLSEAQYADLRKQGVTPGVISYMQQGYAQAVSSFPKLGDDKDLACWSLGFDGFWYSGGPWGLHPDC